MRSAHNHHRYGGRAAAEVPSAFSRRSSWLMWRRLACAYSCVRVIVVHVACMYKVLCELSAVVAVPWGGSERKRRAPTMASARLAMALRKDDDDASPPAFPPSLPPADSTAIKLRKSSLIGVMTWEAMLEKLDLNSKHDYTTCVETILKMLANELASPSDPKYRKIRVSNPNFVAKVLSAKGAPECFQLAGFTETIEAGFLVLPEGADLVNVQRALDALNSHAEGRAQAEEKKRKLELERAARAREERSRKARDERPSEIISEMDMAMMAQHEHRVRDEDEAMVCAGSD